MISKSTKDHAERVIKPDTVTINPATDRLYSNEEMRFLIERERALVDRNKHAFSFVILNTAPAGSDAKELSRFGMLLKRRLRGTDAVGWIGKKNLCVFLPHTNGAEAKVLIDRIYATVEEYTANERKVTYTVYSYPNHAGGHDFSFFSTSAYRDDSRCGPGEADHEVTRILFGRKLPLWKRTLDIIGASVGLLLLSPLFLAVAVLIKTVSRGPVFFKQTRVGYLGKPFLFWKFRTMKQNNKTSGHQAYFTDLINSDRPMEKLENKTEKDPRIIPFGGLLRKTTIDELPQLINVLKGEMSLIGPRPCIPYEAQEYDLWHRKRFASVPGMTGLWQVNGKNRTTFKKMVRLDINYKKNLSLLQDVIILMKTIPAVFGEIKGGKTKATKG